MSESQSVIQGWSKRRRRLVKLSLVAVSLLAGLAVAEIALRVAGFSFITFYRMDAARGYALEPGLEGWYRAEGASFVRVNSEGLRDREHAKPKAPNTFRVALLGDSYAEALQVPQESAFWHLLEARLRACPALAGRDVEVINFGVSGYGTAQELITLREKVWDYSPDLVLLAFTPNNDVIDNSRALKGADYVPYFTFRDGALALDDSYLTSRAYLRRQSKLARLGVWIERHSRVVQALHRAQYVLKQRLTLWRSERAAAARQKSAPQRQRDATPTDEELRARAGELGIDNLIYREPLDDTWREAWRVTEGLLAEMSREVTSRGARFIVVTISAPTQVYPDPSFRQSFMRRVGATDLFYVERRVRAVGAREGFTVFTLAPEMQAYADEHHAFLHGFPGDLGNGHWNADGHRLAAELLSQKLCDWLDGKR
ncbi:MAG: SGNH/GDSL hydrolase family protein [Acidobacteria bacterium]|nr:SGNH/GDSL hydrolase family protein [Acidobacteriota bacterium]